MKKRRKIQVMAGLLTAALLIGSIHILQVEAGASNIIIDKTSFEKELDTSLWYNPDSDVLVENGVLVIPDDSTDTTSLIATSGARVSDYHSELVSAKLDMRLTKLPQDEKFIVAFGLAGIEAVSGEQGNIEIQFVNDGGLKVSVAVYESFEEPTLLVDKAACGTVGDIRMDAHISAEGVLKLQINGKNICDTQLAVSGEGFFGFLQTGNCGAKIHDLRLESHTYDQPENTNIAEDFEKGEINTNLLTSRMIYESAKYAPSRVFIEEQEGNKVFRFQNCSLSYLGTQQQYSNFDMQFDMVYLQRKNETDEEGNIVTPGSENFAVSFGDEAPEYTDWGYETSTDLLVFSPGSEVLSLNTGKVVNAADYGYPYYNPECDKNFTVRISMIDAVIRVYMKWQTETEFKEIMKYQISEETPTGYIHLWTTGVIANFAIDNLKITNLDQDGKLIDVDYRSSLVQVPEDYAYEPMKHVYKPTEEAEDGFNVYLILPAVAGVCLAAIAVAAVVKKKRKDGGTVEERI